MQEKDNRERLAMVAKVERLERKVPSRASGRQVCFKEPMKVGRD